MKKVKIVLIRSFILNCFLVFLKIIVGFLGSSVSLMMDGFHCLSDSLTDLFAIVGTTLSQKPADQKHPYGHGKIEYLISLMIGIGIAILGLSIIFSAFSFSVMIPEDIVLYAAMVSFLMKYFLAKYLQKEGKKSKSTILISSGKESMTDAMTSVIVVLSFTLLKLSTFFPILRYSDLFVSLLIGLSILYTAYLLLRESILSLIGEKEEDITQNENIKRLIFQTKEVLGIKELLIMKYGFYYQVNLTIYLDKTLTLDKIEQITDNLKRRLSQSKENIYYTNINVVTKKEELLCQNYQK